MCAVFCVNENQYNLISTKIFFVKQDKKLFKKISHRNFEERLLCQKIATRYPSTFWKMLKSGHSEYYTCIDSSSFEAHILFILCIFSTSTLNVIITVKHTSASLCWAKIETKSLDWRLIYYCLVNVGQICQHTIVEVLPTAPTISPRWPNNWLPSEY